jgi:hypothetical protein
MRVSLLVAIGLGGVMLLPATPAGAATSTITGFSAPSGMACVTTNLISSSATITQNGLADDLPFDAWDGLPLLNLIEAPAMGDSLSPLAGYNCGDVAHGASATTLGSSVHQSFADTAGQLGAAESGSVSSSSLQLGPITSVAFGESEQEQSATVTPSIGSGVTQFTISVTYHVLSDVSNSAPLIAASFAGAGLDYTVDAGSPSCNGQSLIYDNTGTATAQSPGTYTAGFVFSCPSGQTLTASDPIRVIFYETEDLRLSRGQAATSSVAADLVNATITTGS